MDDSSIKSNISSERESKGITQAELADMLGIDRNTYRSLEKGGTRILNSHLDRLAEVLGVTKEKLVLGYEPLGPEENKKLGDYHDLWQKRYEGLHETYTEEIARLKNEISHLREMNELLKTQIADKQDLINFLKKGGN
ncbi:MAG: helix-turn-helix transcriptional regulator [Bacteroidales bacterium]|nr:helix-turn-helix transcriptional regulator [Bacteroidales bacterium]